MKLSVYMITCNEAKRLPRTLEQARKVADEIIVVDSGSTDSTVDIAKRFGAKTFFHEWNSYCDQKHYAEGLCENDFVLMLDADEVLSDALTDEILKIKETTPLFSAYNVKIANMYPYDEKPNPFALRFNVVRLYDKSLMTVPPDKQNKDRVAVPKGIKIGQLKNEIYHYSLLTLEQAVDKYNKHSSELQRMMAQKHRKISVIRLYWEFPWQFLRYFAGQRYFLQGAKGFSQAMVLAMFRWLKIAKAVEAQRIEKIKKERGE